MARPTPNPFRSRPPRPRGRFWRGPLPIVAALAALAVLVLAWRALVEQRLPPRRELFDPAPQVFVDVEGALAPLYLRGAARADGLLALGDSRALAGLSLSVLEREGVRPVGLLWNGLAQLDHLLEGARALPPRRLLVCLSPASVHDKPRPNMTALLAEERAKTPTARIDERAGRAFGDLRQRLVRTVQPADFRGDTFGGEVDPEAQVGIYRSLLGRATRETRRERFLALGLELQALQREGWRVACVRLPVSPQMLAVEERSFGSERFHELCQALELPFLDLSGEPYATFDGSHLLAAEAQRASGQIALWLRELPGFLAP